MSYPPHWLPAPGCSCTQGASSTASHLGRCREDLATFSAVQKLYTAPNLCLHALPLSCAHQHGFGMPLAVFTQHQSACSKGKSACTCLRCTTWILSHYRHIHNRNERWRFKLSAFMQTWFTTWNVFLDFGVNIDAKKHQLPLCRRWNKSDGAQHEQPQWR